LDSTLVAFAAIYPCSSSSTANLLFGMTTTGGGHRRLSYPMQILIQDLLRISSSPAGLLVGMRHAPCLPSTSRSRSYSSHSYTGSSPTRSHSDRDVLGVFGSRLLPGPLPACFASGALSDARGCICSSIPLRAELLHLRRERPEHLAGEFSYMLSFALCFLFLEPCTKAWSEDPSSTGCSWSTVCSFLPSSFAHRDPRLCWSFWSGVCCWCIGAGVRSSIWQGLARWVLLSLPFGHTFVVDLQWSAKMSWPNSTLCMICCPPLFFRWPRSARGMAYAWREKTSGSYHWLGSHSSPWY